MLLNTCHGSVYLGKVGGKKMGKRPKKEDSICWQCGGKGANVDWNEGVYEIYFCHHCKRTWGVLYDEI